VRATMARSVINPEEGAELMRLYEEHEIAVRRARTILAKEGMESPAFAKADRMAGAIWLRIREIRGDTSRQWS
jgi:hypothetical protein